jgi:hypothetical protein
MPVPSPIYLYRIVHIRNLERILKLGRLTCPTHPKADIHYEGIGDESLKLSRSSRTIPLPPGGTFSDYVAFYFGPRSPMLYNIRHGFLGVRKRPQEEIIYLVSSYEKVKELQLPFVYFDGHAYHHLSQPFNDDRGLAEIDWEAVKAKRWQDDPESDPDRKRRKQAELLVHREVPLTGIIGIAVYQEAVVPEVQTLLDTYNLRIKVKALPDWYY